MDKLAEQIRFLSEIGTYNLMLGIISCSCVCAIFAAVLINFLESKIKGSTFEEKKSFVATSTMTMFFLLYYVLIRLRIGVLYIPEKLYIPVSAIGSIVLITGCVFNIAGRIQLGKNWANHIRIYKDHKLINSGVYKIVRHPLYASLIWMFYAGVLIYPNWAAFLANTFIFVPFMYYRAKQEEFLLEKRFGEYTVYKREVSMFFPKIFKSRGKR